MLTLLDHTYRLARSEWGLSVINPLEGIRRPKADPPRARRLLEGEFQRLMTAADGCRNPHVKPFIRFAVLTAMRRGEILRMEWADLDRAKRLLRIPSTKTGVARTIPLSSEAILVLEEQLAKHASRPFPLTVESFDMAWKRLLARSGIQDLHFHDLRHEGITAFFERGLSIPEVALISGHRDPRMLFRYTHLKPEHLVNKIG